MAVHHPSLTAIRPWRYIPSVWDTLIFALVIGVIALVAFGGHETTQPIAYASRTPLSLDPANLPYYALRTTLRMLAGIVLSFIFTLTYGALAQKSRRAEMVLFPKSVPGLSNGRRTMLCFYNIYGSSLEHDF